MTDSDTLELENRVSTSGKKDVRITVFAAPKSGGGIQWTQKIETPGHDHDGKLKLGVNYNYVIRFSLDDGGLDVRFDAAGPFFVRDGNAGRCPTGMDSDQIMVDSCSADELVVIDYNVDPGDLRYQLNFVNGVGDPVDSYDPIIENGGGGSKA